jgi:hypothetical protein
MARLDAPNLPSSAPFPLNPLYPEKSLGFIIPAFTCVEKDTPGRRWHTAYGSGATIKRGVYESLHRKLRANKGLDPFLARQSQAKQAALAF